MVAVLSIACILFAAVAIAALLSARGIERKLAILREEREATEAAERHCGITGLANRRGVFDWLDAKLATEGARGAVVRVAFLPFAQGLDREGRLARNVAEALQGAASGRTLVGRLGPGEYLLALDGSAGSAALVATARAACNALAGVLADTQRLRVGVALAVSGDTPASLVERAEQGLHLNTSLNPTSLAAADDELQNEVDNRTNAADELGKAIACGRVEPFFQPFVELSSGRVLGFEVLARWRDDSGRLHMPREFLALAEDSGLVGPMYHALLRAAATEARDWPPEWTFSLNLSAQQLRDESLVETTVRTLLEAGIGPGRLDIEISERALELDIDRALEVTNSFRARGIGVVLDNFGSGRLHLKELARIPFGRIKVDEAAVRGEGGNRGVALGLIAAAARHLGVPVIVQGIETRAGAHAAQASGCSIGQGYLFGRPGKRTECFRLEGALAPQPSLRNHAA